MSPTAWSTVTSPARASSIDFGASSAAVAHRPARLPERPHLLHRRAAGPHSHALPLLDPRGWVPLPRPLGVTPGALAAVHAGAPEMAHLQADLRRLAPRGRRAGRDGVGAAAD